MNQKKLLLHYVVCKYFNSLPLALNRLISFTNSSDPDQAQQNVGLDLEANCLII